jgi:hypothetical protein
LDTEAGLTTVQRAESRAWQAYIEELVYPATVWTRFAYPENWEVMKKEPFNKIPVYVRWFFRMIIRYRVKKGLIGHGLGRHTREEVDSILEDCVENLSVRLEVNEGMFLHGKKASTIDCVVYGFLVNAIKERSNPELTSLILEREVLRRYVSRGTRLWFPEYTGILEMVEDESPESTQK